MHIRSCKESERVESCLLICIRSSYKTSYWNWKRTHWGMYHLGNIQTVYIGTPTCADDVAFIERDSNSLQIMINVITRYIVCKATSLQDKSAQNQNT
jgi:hypothetical protein